MSLRNYQSNWGKTCPKCHISQPLYNFEARSTGRRRYICKECTNKYRRERWTRNPEIRKRHRILMLKRKQLYPIKWRARRMIKSMLEKHRKYGVHFDSEIDVEYIMRLMEISDCCPCCKKPFKYEISGRAESWMVHSVDKLIPSKGYVRGNIAIICRRCNTIKQDATPSELRAIADWLEGQMKLQEIAG